MTVTFHLEVGRSMLRKRCHTDEKHTITTDEIEVDFESVDGGAFERKVKYLSNEANVIGSFSVAFNDGIPFNLFDESKIAQKYQDTTKSYAFDLCSVLLYLEYASEQELSDPKTRSNLYTRRFSKITSDESLCDIEHLKKGKITYKRPKLNCEGLNKVLLLIGRHRTRSHCMEACKTLKAFALAVENVEGQWNERHQALICTKKKKNRIQEDGFVYLANGGIEGDRLLRKIGSTERTAQEGSKELKLPIVDSIRTKYPELLEHYCLAQIKKANFFRVKHDYFYIDKPDDDRDLIEMICKSKKTIDTLMEVEE